MENNLQISVIHMLECAEKMYISWNEFGFES